MQKTLNKRITFKGAKHSLLKALVKYLSIKRSNLLFSEKSQSPSVKEGPGPRYVDVTSNKGGNE